MHKPGLHYLTVYAHNQDAFDVLPNAKGLPPFHP